MIIVTGTSGQLGSELKQLCGNEYQFIDRSILNLNNPDAVRKFFDNTKITGVIHGAAYTNVELAETEKDMAFLINQESSRAIAEMAKKHQYKMTYISTDFVFDGKKSTPYTEKDTTNPLNIYGQSKLGGEIAIKDSDCDHLILRTSWVYSTFGNNFVKKIIKLTETQKNLKVIQDQIGSLTYAKELAEVILKSQELKGTYHFSNEGSGSWYDVACEIKRSLKMNVSITPVFSEEFKSKATRPHYSLLSKKKIKNDLKIDIPHWVDSLQTVIKKL